MSNLPRLKPLTLALIVTAGFAGGYLLRPILTSDKASPPALAPAPSTPSVATTTPTTTPETPRIAADFVCEYTNTVIDLGNENIIVVIYQRSISCGSLGSEQYQTAKR